MAILPFTISESARAWISARLQLADKFPQLASLAPALTIEMDFQTMDPAGRVTRRFEGEYFDIGWDQRSTLVEWGWLEIELVDARVFASPCALDALAGKHLTVEAFEVGVPTPASTKVALLVAKE